MEDSREIRLPEVSLLAASAVSIEDTVEALRTCSRNIAFAAVKLLSQLRPASLPSGMEHVPIPPMDFLGYSRFILRDLHRHFDTTHCLVVQADGFIVNPRLWRDEFLSYDYIGAPWADHVVVTPGNWKLPLDRNRVGNGGFSLRSRKLMRIAADIDFDRLAFPLRSEDLVLCHFLYARMCEQGVRFAPPELAAQFSMESPDQLYGQRLDTVFGFHGKALLPAALGRLPEDAFPGLRARLGRPTLATGPRPGRNDPCPCGSGKRFKACHGLLG